MRLSEIQEARYGQDASENPNEQHLHVRRTVSSIVRLRHSDDRHGMRMAGPPRGRAVGFASKETLRAGAFVLQQLLFTVLILYVARMFARISLEETPFFKELSRKIKVAAALLFLAFALPQWAFWVSLCLTGNPTGFVLLNEVSASAFLAAAVVFCLARIFEYGYLVQDENFEII